MTFRMFRIFSSLIVLLAQAISLQAQQAGLTAETWNNLSQKESVLVLQQEGISSGAADSTSTTGAEITAIANAGTGMRLRGTVTPVATDTYTFWVNGADNVALWISSDASRFNKTLIAYNLNATNSGEWDKHANQRSIPIQLHELRLRHAQPPDH